MHLMTSSGSTSKPTAAGGQSAIRSLTIEALEPREMLAIALAGRFDSVLVSSTDAQIRPQIGPSDADGSVLVINGTTGNDTITVKLNPTIAGAVDVLFNNKRTTYAAPIEAIVAHGGKGNDTITVDAGVGFAAFLFGGAGNDRLNGGSGDDMLIGGDGNDILQGGFGLDMLVGSAGVDQLYGRLSNSPGSADNANILVAASLQDNSLQWLQNFRITWLGDIARDGHVATAQNLLGTSIKPGGTSDRLYQGTDSDWVLAASGNGNNVQISIPGINGAWFSRPSTANGVTTYTVTSDCQRAATNIRVLAPTTLQPGKVYQVIYVLPVEAGNGRQFGDGLTTIQQLGLQNSKDVIFVEPSFADVPWYADCVSNSQIRQETYFCSVVVPFIEQRYSVLTQPEGRLLLGYSKSGYGAFTLLLRHPEMFGRAFAWDSPLAMSNPAAGWAFPQVLGSSKNFENYRISTLLAANATFLQSQPSRLIMMGAGLYTGDHLAIHNLMVKLGIPHTYIPGTLRAHLWASGWMSDAVSLLLSGGTVA